MMVRVRGVVSAAANDRVGELPERCQKYPGRAPSATWSFGRRSTVTGLAALAGSLVMDPRMATASDPDDKPDPVALWAALEDTRTTLEAGLIAGEQRGIPVSASFNIEDGDLALIVYVAVGQRYTQLFIDPGTAALVQTASVAASDDLADATVRKAALDKGARSLVAVVREALRENIGARAVDVMPELQNGHPVAGLKCHSIIWRTCASSCACASSVLADTSTVVAVLMPSAPGSLGLPID